MGVVSVTIDPKGLKGLHILKINEILFLERNPKVKDGLIVHSVDNHYYLVGTLIYWTELFNANGYNFYSGDRSNSINVSQVVYIDRLLSVAYFNSNKNGKRAAIARHRYEEVTKDLCNLNLKIITV